MGSEMCIRDRFIALMLMLSCKIVPKIVTKVARVVVILIWISIFPHIFTFFYFYLPHSTVEYKGADVFYAINSDRDDLIEILNKLGIYSVYRVKCDNITTPNESYVDILLEIPNKKRGDIGYINKCVKTVDRTFSNQNISINLIFVRSSDITGCNSVICYRKVTCPNKRVTILYPVEIVDDVIDSNPRFSDSKLFMCGNSRAFLVRRENYFIKKDKSPYFAEGYGKTIRTFFGENTIFIDGVGKSPYDTERRVVEDAHILNALGFDAIILLSFDNSERKIGAIRTFKIAESIKKKGELKYRITPVSIYRRILILAVELCKYKTYDNTYDKTNTEWNHTNN